MISIQGKVAVVTGASSGIGYSLVRTLANNGMKVVATARRKEKLLKLQKECKAFPIAGDVLDEKLPNRLIELAIAKYGRCDVLCNNAGIMHTGTVDNMDLENMSKMVRVNVEAAYRMAYVFAKYFKKNSTGQIINISSILGTKVRAEAGAYAGTKYAIEALSEGLRLELAGTGVRVTAIQPGLVMTELHDHCDIHPKEKLGLKNPLAPSDIAEAVLFALQQPENVLIPKMMVLPSEHSI
ncbi:MAG: SDR family oxidoreductase [Bacteroidetes bacterium]|nr:SDR family oxidoreductase [Bacteroidota bacterium]